MNKWSLLVCLLFSVASFGHAERYCKCYGDGGVVDAGVCPPVPVCPTPTVCPVIDAGSPVVDAGVADAGGTGGGGGGTPTVDAGVASGAQFEFESSVQGWVPRNSGMTLTSSAAKSFAGSRSMAVSVVDANGNTPALLLQNPATPNGAILTAHVFVPADMPISAIQLFAQGASWDWAGVWYVRASGSIAMGAWNTFVLSVPSGTGALRAIGLEFQLSASYTGTLFVDTVGWDNGAPAPVDAGSPVVDAGLPAVDAGSPVVDAGAPVGGPDAGSIAPGGIMPTERMTTWNPGLNSIGGIPNRTTLCASLAPSGGDDTAPIQTAIDNCPADQVVKLAAGVFRISGNGIQMRKSNVTLRGAGPGSTRLVQGDTGGSVIVIGQLWSSDKRMNPVSLDTNGVKGSNTITLASVPSPALTVGQLVYVDQLENTSISRYGDRSPPGDPSRGWFGRIDRPITQIFEVAAINGVQVTFTTPLHINFLTSYNSQLLQFGERDQNYPVTKKAGVEDLSVENGHGGDGGGNIHFFVASYSWVKNVESSMSNGTGVNIDASFRCEVRDSIIRTSANPNPGGGGYLVGINSGAADNLIENNVIWSGNKIIVMRTAGGGNVIAYNYAQDAFGAGYPTIPEAGLNASHMAASHYELFEGNECFSFAGDDTWGGAAYITAFRNSITGTRTHKAPLTFLVDQGLRKVVGVDRMAWYYTFIGNVLGADDMKLVSPQQFWSYESTPGVGSASGFFNAYLPIWAIGYNGSDFNALPDQKTVSTLIRHGNFDYVTNTVRWDPNNSNHVLPDSLYLKAKPAFFGSNVWPWVDPTAATPGERVRVLPAKERFKTMP